MLTKRLYILYVIPGLELDTSDGKFFADTLGKSLGVLSVGVPGCHLVNPHLMFGVLCSRIGGKPKEMK